MSNFNLAEPNQQHLLDDRLVAYLEKAGYHLEKSLGKDDQDGLKRKASVVVKATHMEQGAVALKVVDCKKACKEDFLAREKKLTPSLKNSNIISTCKILEFDYWTIFVREYCPGRSLLELLEEKQRLPEDVSTKVACFEFFEIRICNFDSFRQFFAKSSTHWTTCTRGKFFTGTSTWNTSFLAKLVPSNSADSDTSVNSLPSEKNSSRPFVEADSTPHRKSTPKHPTNLLQWTCGAWELSCKVFSS